MNDENLQRGRDGRVPTPELVDLVTQGLNAGLTTTQIARDCQIEYESLRRRLKRTGETALLARLDDKRSTEGRTLTSRTARRYAA